MGGTCASSLYTACTVSEPTGAAPSARGRSLYRPVASLVSRSGALYVNFYDSTRTPKSRRFALGTKDKSTARALITRLEQAQRLEGWDPWTGTPDDVLAPRRTDAPVTLAEAVERFVSTKRDGSPYTVRNYRRVLGLFVRLVGPAVPLARVKPAHVAAFLDAPHLKASTVRYRHTVVRALNRWAVAEGIAPADVASRVEPPRAPGKVPRAVTEPELTAVCAAIPEGKAWMRPALWFALYTGLRAGELGRLRWRDVDESGRLLRVEVQKNGKPGTVPLPARALAVLDGVERGGPNDYVFVGRTEGERSVSGFVTYLSDTFRAARRAAGVDRPITPHGLRHAFCTRLAEAGKSAFVIQAAARHSNVQTSARYVHLANAELRADLDDVFGTD